MEIPENFPELHESTRLKIYDKQLELVHKCEVELEAVEKSRSYTQFISQEWYEHHLEKVQAAYRNAYNLLIWIYNRLPPA